MCSARRRSPSTARTPASSSRATTSDAPDPTCAPFELVPCDVFITEATFGLPVFRHPRRARRGERSCWLRCALFPERAHLVGAYALGKAQRVMALLREAGYDEPIYLHGAMETLTRLYKSRGIALGDSPKVEGATKAELAGAIVVWRRPRRIQDLWTRRFPDPVTASPRAGCGCARAPARRASNCRWSSPTMPTGTILTARSARPAPARSGSPMARRTRWCIGARRSGIKARPLHCSAMATRTSEEAAGGRGERRMNRFADLLDRLAYEPAPQRQAAAARGLFPRHARSRPRLGAGGADRRADVQGTPSRR